MSALGCDVCGAAQRHGYALCDSHYDQWCRSLEARRPWPPGDRRRLVVAYVDFVTRIKLEELNGAKP